MTGTMTVKSGSRTLKTNRTDLVSGDGGSMQVQQCLGASNWRARRR